MRRFLLVLTLIATSLVVPIGASAQEGPGPCEANYFPQQDMWEITWGRQFDNTGGLPTFTMESFGGLTGLNGGPVPAYMTDYTGDGGWRWLYVTGTQIEEGRTITYEFADGTVITADVSDDANGCPAVAWTTQAPEDPAPDPTTTTTTIPESTTTTTAPPAIQGAGAAAAVQAAPTYTG